MDPMTTITACLTSIKTADEIAKLLKDANLSLEKAELKLKLADLVGALADAKMQIAEIKDVVLEKDRILEELKQKEDLTSKMRFERPFYWLVDGDSRTGPYCQQCWDSSQQVIRLKDHRNGIWSCTNCRNDYDDGTRRPDPPRVVRREF